MSMMISEYTYLDWVEIEVLLKPERTVIHSGSLQLAKGSGGYRSENTRSPLMAKVVIYTTKDSDIFEAAAWLKWTLHVQPGRRTENRTC